MEVLSLYCVHLKHTEKHVSSARIFGGGGASDSTQRCLALDSFLPWLFLTHPAQTWGTWSGCRIDYLKTELSREIWALNTSSIPLVLAVILAGLLFVLMFVLKDLAPYEAGIKASAPFSRSCIPT